MTFQDSIKTCLNKYATFSGRATRSEFWFWCLGVFVVQFLLVLIWDPLYSIFTLFCIIPNLAVIVRRLHDTNHSGWWWFLVCVPIIGVIIIFIWLCKDSQGDNEYGPNPKANKVE